MSTPPRVTVAGGGLAGMTAALRLAQRGYQVKLYEQKSMLGGNLASRPSVHGMKLDVYPHMFLSWYHNFWRIMDEAGVDRRKWFIPIISVKQLRRNQYPQFTSLTNGYSPRYMVRNLFSGMRPPADMFVFWYSTIDLLAERLNPTMLLDDVSVTGFLQARPYMTEGAVSAVDAFITMVWAIPAYQACAEDYRSYLAYSVASYRPPCLLAKGSAAERVIGPLTAALEAAGVEIHTDTEITRVTCANGRATEIGLRDTTWDRHQYQWIGGDERTEPVEELVLAVPPLTLSSLVRQGGDGQPIVKVVPRLAELARLRSQRIPIVHVFFKRKLRHIPPEPVGLFGSRLALAFTDISETWPELGERTVLSVSASDPYGLPGTGPRDDGFAIISELAEYVDFELGSEWGDSTEIDWQRTQYEANWDSQLFINETGIDIWRPTATCAGLQNVSFAGNFCANRIGMMTVESAVASGLEAARVIVARNHFGAPVEIIEPDASFDALCVWLRYAWAPYAYAAKSWSRGSDWFKGLKDLLSENDAPGDV